MAAVKKMVIDHLDLWTAAIKRKSTAGRGSARKVELYGIKKLRELILNLAVRGLLVPQDPNVESASELLKRIAAEKVKMVKEGKIKKEMPLSPIGDKEKPFELPSGWSWTKLGMLMEMFNGRAFKQTEWATTGLPIIRIQNLNDKNAPFNFFDGELSDAHRVDTGDLLISWSGTPGTSFGAFIWTRGSGALNQHINKCRIFGSEISKEYLRLAVNSCMDHLIENAQGGVGLKHVTKGTLNNLVFGLPPLSEQHLIVAKVNDLMALCDQLEQQTEASLDARQALVGILLDTLINTASHEQLTSAWQRITTHFETLFTTEHSIDQLKQTIRQLAVMGKLVPQDPNDEPASELLEKIAAEKAVGVKERKIKNHPPVDPLGKSQILPDTWVEILVQDFADIRLGSTPSRTEPRFWNGDIPWVSSGEVANCIIRDTSEHITQEGFKNSSTSMIPARSLLMAIIGQGKTRGQTALLEIDACTNQNVAAFVFNELFICPEYVWIWAKSKYESHRDDGHGGAQPALNGKKVRSFRFPLAPILEQHRIVSKVEELLALCDQLKDCFNDAQITQMHLADAIAEQALKRSP
jgi:type I restriction enzyme S subunit